MSLEYNGRPMQIDPVNIPFEAVADSLRKPGSSIIFAYEPGDGTRYTILIRRSESADELDSVGIPRTEANEWFFFALLNDNGVRHAQWLHSSYRLQAYDFGNKNRWERELFSWFFNHLFAVIFVRNFNDPS